MIKTRLFLPLLAFASGGIHAQVLFDADFDDADFDTIGGIITHAFGHMPARNELVEIQGYRFRILYADNRQIHLVRLTKI